MKQLATNAAKYGALAFSAKCQWTLLKSAER